LAYIIPALIPIFSLILIGYFFKKIAFPAKEFWPMADKFTYYVLMPALLVYKLSFAPSISFDSIYLILTAIITTCLALFLLVFLNYFIKFKGDIFTSIVQGGIRFNTYVYLALVDAIYGDAGLLLAVIVITFAIPLINLLCIIIFSIYIPKTHLSFYNVGKSIISNPLIIACIVGGFINLTAIPIPIALEKLLMILSNAALPLGLLSVGVGLHFREILSSKLGLVLSTLVKLAIYPFIMLMVARYFELDTMSTNVLLIFATLPTAASSYILARQMGGNINLMSSIITVQTLMSILSIAVILQIISI